MVEVQQAYGASGAQFFRFNSGDNTVWLKDDKIGSTSQEAMKTLSGYNITTTHKVDIDDIWRDLGGKAPPFPGNILESSGWSPDGSRFGQPGGDILGRADGEICEPVYLLKNQSNSHQGTALKWRLLIARRVQGQHLPMFALMTPMASPLLDLMEFDYAPCFELSGKKGIGKTTIQKLSSSFYGPQILPKRK